MRNNAAFVRNLSFVFVIYNFQAITILSQQESEGVLNISLFCKIFTNDGFFLIVVSDLGNAIFIQTSSSNHRHPSRSTASQRLNFFYKKPRRLIESIR